MLFKYLTPTKAHITYIYLFITLYKEPWTSRFLVCYNANVKHTSQKNTEFEFGTLTFFLTIL
jgi:hypothetical protein